MDAKFPRLGKLALFGGDLGSAVKGDRLIEIEK